MGLLIQFYSLLSLNDTLLRYTKKLKKLAVAAGLADKNDSAELAAKNFIRQIEELNARELEQFYYDVMEKNEADKKSDKNN